MKNIFSFKSLNSLPVLILCGLLALGAWTGTRLLADMGGTGGGPLTGTILVTVVEEGTDDGTGNPLPVPGAFVMVGLAEDDPFPGNHGFADANGEISFSDPALTGMQTVTAGASGYQYYSFVDVDAAEIVISLEPRITVFTSSVTGGLTGFSGVNNDGNVQLGLTLQTMRIEDLTRGLDIAGMLSPEVSVNFPIAGATCLPGNVYIPTQFELLFFKLEKTEYQLALPTGTTQQIFCFGAEIGLTALLDLLGGEELDIGALLSALVPLEVGVLRDVNISGDLTGQNINMANNLDLSFTVNTSSMPADMDVLLTSLGEINGDLSEAPGGGDLLLLGIRSVPGPSGSDVVSATSATGDFSDMRYVIAAIAANVDEISEGVTGLLDRSDSPPGSALTLDTPFLRVVLDPVAGNLFSFSDATQSGVSPLPDMNISSLTLTTTVPADPASCDYVVGDTVSSTETLWTLVSPGQDLAFYLPILPAAAPDILPFTEETPEDDQLDWSHTVMGLGLDPLYDFNAVYMDSVPHTLTHFSFNVIDFSVDADMDGEHLFDDNCIFDSNPDQADLDGDGAGNACDPDADGDGYLAAADDCDDLDAAVNPGAVETCDGVDNNCVNGIDEEPAASASCDNGLYCDGAESCVSGSCQAGTAPDCDDGVGCTTDACNEGTDSCDNTPDDGACDDDLWCTGAETCDAVSDCQAGSPPCEEPLGCDEVNDICTGCLTDEDCNDGVNCTEDACDAGTCTNIPDDAACDDGLWCTGSETCDPVADCQAGTAPNCDDGVGCTADACNEGADACDNVPDDGACDDGLWCTGAETCDPVADCQDGTAPDCDDGVGCTADACNEGTDSCDNTPDDGACDDGLWCNGAETCDAAADCLTGTPVDCDDGNDCTDDGCDEVGDVCENTCNAGSAADPCCDDPACAGDPVCAGDCVDLDGDGYGNPADPACPYPEEDCDDDNPDVNPGMTEIPGNGLDDDCDPGTPAWGTPASIMGTPHGKTSAVANHLFLLFIPVGIVLGWKRFRKIK